MSKRRAGVGVVALNGYLYAVGGFDDASPLDTMERYAHVEAMYSLSQTLSDMGTVICM